jgi:putative ABC transport system permease protein
MIRFAARTFLRNRGFTLAVVVTFGLGIALNSVMFGVINAILLRPLVADAAGRLVVIWGSDAHQPKFTVGGETFKFWRDHAATFEGMAAAQGFPATLLGLGDPQQIDVPHLSANYFSIYHVDAILGRTFLPDEDQPGHNHVAVLDHHFWRTRLGADRYAIGKKLNLGGDLYTIIGVLPEWFKPLAEKEVYVPLVLDENPGVTLLVVGALRPGFSIETARAEMETISRRLELSDPKKYTGMRALVVPMLDFSVGDIRALLWLLFGCVALVLLIACVNVMNLLLTRATGRRREIEIRTAIGASRWQIVRQLLTESLMLATAGAALGIVLAAWGIQSVRRLLAGDLSRIDEVTFDWRVLAFALGLTGVAALLAGIYPALFATRPKPPIRTGWARYGLTSAEVALTFLLLIVSGLLMRSFVRLQNAPAGYNPNNVLTFVLNLPETKDANGARIAAFYQRVLHGISKIPGVESEAAATDIAGWGIGLGFGVDVAGRPKPAVGEEPSASGVIAGPGYFRTMQIPILYGRDFSRSDRLGSPRVVIVNQKLAQHFFSGQDAIGKKLILPSTIDPNLRGDDHKEEPQEIVGVVGNVIMGPVQSGAPYMIYLPLNQSAVRYTMIAVRTERDPESILPAIRHTIAQEDPNQPVSDAKTLEERAGMRNRRTQIVGALMTSFAALALFLAMFGLYAVAAYGTSQRTREIGIRMALGAKPSDVCAAVMARLGWSLLIGVMAGACGAIVAARLLAAASSDLLYQTSPTDPTVYTSVVVLLAIAAFFATLRPARRAIRIDPATALRHE